MSKVTNNQQHQFTSYHFPAVGQAVSLLTLRSKLGQCSTEVEDEQTTYYGWWAHHDGNPSDIEGLIPDVGGTIKFHAPSFWDWASGVYYTLLRVKHNVFLVVDAQ